jgi:5-methylcytosine-specific restriction endonuclease McrA
VSLRNGRHPHYYDRDRLELDHIIPCRVGGRSVAANLAVCCSLCNRRRGGEAAARLTVFRRFLATEKDPFIAGIYADWRATA